MVQRRRAGRPWQGPLPPPRVSPVRTLGDELNKAIRSKKLSPWRGETAKGLSPVIAGDAQKQVNRQEADAANVQNSKFVNRPHVFPETDAASKDGSLGDLKSPSSTTGVGPPGKVLIGLGRWFRPTPGLVALFSRTGTSEKPGSTGGSIEKQITILRRGRSLGWRRTQREHRT